MTAPTVVRPHRRLLRSLAVAATSTALCAGVLALPAAAEDPAWPRTRSKTVKALAGAWSARAATPSAPAASYPVALTAPTDLAFQDGRLWVADSGAVVAIDPLSGARVASIPIVGAARVSSPDDTFGADEESTEAVYASSRGRNTISVIDTATRSVSYTVDVADTPCPDALAWTPVGVYYLYGCSGAPKLGLLSPTGATHTAITDLDTSATAVSASGQGAMLAVDTEFPAILSAPRTGGGALTRWTVAGEDSVVTAYDAPGRYRGVAGFDEYSFAGSQDSPGNITVLDDVGSQVPAPLPVTGTVAALKIEQLTLAMAYATDRVVGLHEDIAIERSLTEPVAVPDVATWYAGPHVYAAAISKGVDGYHLAVMADVLVLGTQTASASSVTVDPTARTATGTLTAGQASVAVLTVTDPDGKVTGRVRHAAPAGVAVTLRAPVVYSGTATLGLEATPTQAARTFATRTFTVPARATISYSKHTVKNGILVFKKGRKARVFVTFSPTVPGRFLKVVTQYRHNGKWKKAQWSSRTWRSSDTIRVRPMPRPDELRRVVVKFKGDAYHTGITVTSKAMMAKK